MIQTVTKYSHYTAIENENIKLLILLKYLWKIEMYFLFSFRRVNELFKI